MGLFEPMNNVSYTQAINESISHWLEDTAKVCEIIIHTFLNEWYFPMTARLRYLNWLRVKYFMYVVWNVQENSIMGRKTYPLLHFARMFRKSYFSLTAAKSRR